MARGQTQESEAMIVAFSIPIKTVSEANVRCHWRVRAKRAKGQRTAAYVNTLVAGAKHIALPAVVTITRVAPRALDCDNLASSQKHIRDGIADALGIDDRDPRVTWAYRQRKGPMAVEVIVEGRPA